MDLKTAYERFIQLPIPGNGVDNRAIKDLFFDLVEYDSYVAGYVDEATGSRPSGREIPVYDPSIEEQLQGFLSDAKNDNPNDVREVHAMLSYLQEIKNLIAIGRLQQGYN